MNPFPKSCTEDQSDLPDAGAGQLIAAIEVVVYLALTASATFCFVMGWLSCEAAGVLTALLLVSLIVLAWKRFDGGRHPCFLFLCMLTLFQAGRLIAYCAGEITDIFRVTLMTAYQFDVSRNVSGMALLSLALSALCIYAPCRWIDLSPAVLPPRTGSCDRYLPYLYFLLCLTMPLQLFKNYRYYEYAQDHGGYLVFFVDHGGLAASIPLAVRATSLISLPAFIGIFVLERRTKFLWTAAMVYFMITAPILLIGSRGAIFSLTVSLWYLAKVKSGQHASLYRAGILAAMLVLAAGLIGSMRVDHRESRPLSGPSQFIPTQGVSFLATQGVSFDVTEVAIAYRRHFAPYVISYLTTELRSAFVASDQTNYVLGRSFADDMSSFLNPTAYQFGFGSGSSYVAETYVVGGLGGVALISVFLGVLLHGMHRCARNSAGLFVVGMILPDVLWMARGGLLDWVSSAIRVGISILILLVGWNLFQAVARMGGVLGLGNRALDR